MQNYFPFFQHGFLFKSSSIFAEISFDVLEEKQQAYNFYVMTNVSIAMHLYVSFHSVATEVEKCRH